MTRQWWLTVRKSYNKLMDNLNKVTREFGMKINVKKTKMVHIGQKESKKLEDLC